MTKQGYTQILVPKQLHQTLKKLAEENQTSIAKTIHKLLQTQTSIDTSIDTKHDSSPEMEANKLNHSFSSQKNQETSLISQNSEGKVIGNRRCPIWWAGRDLNSRPAPREGAVIAI